MLQLAPSFPTPSPARIQRALILLERVLPGRVLTDPASCEPYASDASEARGQIPFAVVRAETTEQIALALEAAHIAEVPVTPRAGGTGRAGGAVPVGGGIVLSTLGANKVKDIDRAEQVAVVEPGLLLCDLHSAVEAEGLFYPPDPNSLTACALAGNVACNAGGPRAFKYGVTGQYVLGIDTVLMGGDRCFVGRRTLKGVTGYDVTSLLVGSEGTLAVFGDITLRLIPKPDSVVTLLALFRDADTACRATNSIVSAGIRPRCMELLDAATLGAVRAAGNPISDAAQAMLIIEVDGSETECERAAARIGDVCEEVGVLDVLVAQDAAQRDRLWTARREMSPAVRRMAKNKLSEDVVVPRRHIGELLKRVNQISEREGIQGLCYGHAGDGNLHVNFLWNEPDEERKVGRAVEQLFRDVVQLGGTLTGEHGVGVTKAPYLHLEQSRSLIALQRTLKRSFDPKGLLNPGKIFPS